MIIWLASYPRSGNTFLRIVLNKCFNIKTYSVYGDKFDIASHKKTSDVVGHKQLPENFEIETARKSKKLYLIKTHGYIQTEDKVIYLVRDGRESIASYLQYEKNFHEREKSVKDIIIGNVGFSSWADHIATWNPLCRKNTLLIKFENLIDDPVKHIDDISQFLDIKPISDDIPTFKQLNSINPKFFRSGKNDSWASLFSIDDIILFWLRSYNQMKDMGYDNSIPSEITSIDNSIWLGMNEIQKNIIDRNQKLEESRALLTECNQQLEESRALLTERNQKLEECLKQVSKSLQQKEQ